MNDDLSLFREAVSGIAPIAQDKVTHDKKIKLRAKANVQQKGRSQSRQVAASFAFSDIYEANMPSEGPVRYCREDVSTHVLKQLRRGDYYPELILDLHGLTKESAKLELAALIHAARKELIECVGIVHGIGQGILKRALPHYLIQHPHVKAFHQAPLEYGGQGALLVMIETSDPRYRE
ncbi:endonuclease SmrB [Alteromonas pelagimontana]|uniref:Ribosome rescue factor SmrB n=2 Tax=Alteromonas pelagimontana TaxID=1858656 RepID=A0A6M4M9Z6_9ALTE|nr:endonuclease SmrB [Alteromonas pelagimontana]QJR79917.1 endonuclease SmrB [Alteromonas pelagimontana]